MLTSQKLALLVDETFRKAVLKDLPLTAAQLRLYLEDAKTVSILLSHIHDTIIDRYVDFRRACEAFPAQNGLSFSSSPEELRLELKLLC